MDNCSSPAGFSTDTLERIKNDLKTAIRKESSIVDCAILLRQARDSSLHPTIFVVLNAPCAPDQLKASLASTLDEHKIAQAAITPIARIPLTLSGEIDFSTLDKVPVFDPTLLTEWEREILTKAHDVDKVILHVENREEPMPSVHLFDLMGAEQEAAAGEIKKDKAQVVHQANPRNDLQVKKPAIAHGQPLIEKTGEPTTLSEVLQRAALNGENRGVVCIQADGSELFRSYGELLTEAERILAGLRRMGLQPHDKIIFQLDRNQDFIACFWACILGGFVPVPVSVAPSYDLNDATVNKLYNTWLMLERPFILTSAHLANAINTLARYPKFANLMVMTLETLEKDEPDPGWHQGHPDDLALMILTSGSTGMPKGVMLSHRNMISRSAGTMQMHGFSCDDISLNWFALDHVVGLVMFHIRDVYLTCQQIHAPIEVVLQDPLKWLDWVSRFKVTVTWAPNFAYGLVNACESEIAQRHWDLSSLKTIINGGEAVVAKTARRFMELLVPHKLPKTSMRPAWGMAETSSGIVLSDNFSLDGSTDLSPYVDLGNPIPGVSLRIVNEQGEVLGEGESGRLFVHGTTITSGYYNRPELNDEIFSEDGWFNTGDLAFIKNGRLTLTGREKDVIIINGVNYSNHEIESEVESISDIEPSFTAATAVLPPNSDSERLAIFFHSPITTEKHLISLLKKIRLNVVKNIGINPDFLIPVDKKDIPKTAIGKIQRAQLRKRFEAGDFAHIVRQVDVYQKNTNTIPEWFYRKVWRSRKVPSSAAAPQAGRLVFLDSWGLGQSLCDERLRQNTPCVKVEAGRDFVKFAPHHYCIAAGEKEHYRRLLASIIEDGIEISEIVHLWNFATESVEIVSQEALEESQHKAFYSLLYVAQACADSLPSSNRIRLLVVSSSVSATTAKDQVSFEKGAISGFLKTLPQELPWLNCCHVDLQKGPISVNRDYLLQELQTDFTDGEVAYRDGQRLVSRLKRVEFKQEQRRQPHFQAGSMYLMSGGLGGIGTEIAANLLDRYKIRLLLIGRTPLPENDDSIPSPDADGLTAKRLDAYRSLTKLGDVIYKAVDVCDSARLQEIVAAAKSGWQCELAGIIHLAGEHHESSILDESSTDLASALRPKIAGSWVLHNLIKDRPGALFISFSSASGFFGGATVGAFAAASTFLDSFSHYLRDRYSLQSYNLSWTLWNEIGMSRGYQMKAIAQSRGFCAIPAGQGVTSFLIASRYNPTNLIIGLDGGNRQISRSLDDARCTLQQLTAYFTAKPGTAEVGWREMGFADHFGNEARCDFVQIDEMPVTSTGEIDRKKLVRILHDKDLGPLKPLNEVEQQLAVIWQEVLGLAEVGKNDNFFELGGHSLLLAKVHGKLQKLFPNKISVVEMFKYPTIHDLAHYLNQEKKEQPAARKGQARAAIRNRERGSKVNSDIAIIGLSCRFPGAEDFGSFWKNLCDGKESITFFTEEEVLASGVDPALIKDPAYVKAGPIIPNIEDFDAEFFGINANEARILDPQHRIFFESAWECLEDAGYNPYKYQGAIGVYAAVGMNTYLLNNLYVNRAHLSEGDPTQALTVDSMGGFHVMTTNDKEYLSTRLSYRLNLRGPSINVQTACSSTLVTMHMACQSLLNGECDMALSGGVSIKVPQTAGYLFQDGAIVSPDGHCRAFDADAQGTIFGDGVGIVLLKRLDEAIADRDHIYGVIKGTALNNDGGVKVGYMAPSEDGQASVITEALAMSGVGADTIGYVEAHGTGTVLGDPIEVGALTQAFRATTEKTSFCPIGSVKTNIGHLQITSGVAGFIKTALCLHHKTLVPTLHYKNPNPMIDFASTPFYVNTELREWQRLNGNPLRAGVNSLGIGGANVHVILEEAPSGEVSDNIIERPRHLLALSARNTKALRELVGRYENFSATAEDQSLADICYTANTGRHHFAHRTAFVAESVAKLHAQLAIFGGTAIADDLAGNQTPDPENPGVVFLFTGQGAQYPGMGRQLFETQPTFRRSMERCAEILRPLLETDLLELLYQEREETEEREAPLNQTAHTQPALFAVEYSLAQLWRSWGVEPAVVMGHSVGEYVAACIAGVFSLEDALKLIAARGRLMQALPAGGEMAALLTDEERVDAALKSYGEKIAIAAINGPLNTVISGESAAVRDLCRAMEAEGVGVRRLNVSHAFHSPLMEPMMAEFARVAAQVTYSSPATSLISNVSGGLAGEEMSSPGYWVEHIRQPVRFADSIETLHQLRYKYFLEVGPHPTLLGMANYCLPPAAIIGLPSLRKGGDDWQIILQSMAHLYMLGIDPEWNDFDKDYKRNRLSLPTYPFQRKRYWIDAPQGELLRSTPVAAHQVQTPLLDIIARGDVHELNRLLREAGNFTEDQVAWSAVAAALIKMQQKQLAAACGGAESTLYRPQWKLQTAAAAGVVAPQPLAADESGRFLILADKSGLGEHLANLLKQGGGQVLLLYAADSYEKIDDGTWKINPAHPADFEKVLEEIAAPGAPGLGHIVHLWSLDTPPNDDLTGASLQEAQILSCASLLHLLQGMGGIGLGTPRLVLVTRGAMGVGVAPRPPSLAQAPLWGLAKAVAAEHQGQWGGIIDLDPEAEKDEANLLLHEILHPSGEEQLAYRGNQRYSARLSPAGPGRGPAEEVSFRPGGTYLITGGLGALGLKTSEWLVNHGADHLVLIGRSKASPEARGILARLEETGANIKVVGADVADAEQMAAVLGSIAQEGPPLRGIIHAAGVLDDGMLQLLEWPRFAKVLAPKMEGAWNLHELTKKSDLDFFILFSSVASLLGSPGQGNYAAANSFLDGFAHYRRSLGLPALSVNWGPWAEAGMAAKLSSREREKLAAQGVEMLSPELNMLALGELLAREETQGAVLSIDWRRYRQQFTNAPQPTFLAELLPADGPRPADSASPGNPQPAMLAAMKGASAEGRRERFIHLLQHEVAGVLGLDASTRPDPKQGFFDMGMDSFMSLELRKRLEIGLGITLPSTLAYDFPTISTLAEFLLSRFVDQEAVPAGVIPPGHGIPAADDVVTQVNQLSEAEVEASIAEELAKLESIVN